MIDRRKVWSNKNLQMNKQIKPKKIYDEVNFYRTMSEVQKLKENTQSKETNVEPQEDKYTASSGIAGTQPQAEHICDDTCVCGVGVHKNDG